MSAGANGFTIRAATPADVPVLLQFIRELAEYEKLTHEVVIEAAQLHTHLFGPRPCAEAVLGFAGDEPVAYALFFQNFSTFLGRPGLYLEDLFVRAPQRHRGYGRALLEFLAGEANRRGCGRFEWTVLDWNEPAKRFYDQFGATMLRDWRVCRVTGAALEKFRPPA